MEEAGRKSFTDSMGKTLPSFHVMERGCIYLERVIRKIHACVVPGNIEILDFSDSGAYSVFKMGGVYTPVWNALERRR